MIEDLENKYKRIINSLSTRAKFVLASTQLDKFQNYYLKYIIQNEDIDFLQIVNCGTKTKLELDRLSLLADQYKKDLSDNQPGQYSISNENISIFERQFHKLSARSRNILGQLQATNLAGFIDHVFMEPSTFVTNKIRNCGSTSYNEIIEFKKQVLSLLKKQPLVLLTDNNGISVANELFPLGVDSKSFDQFSELKFEQSYTGLSIRAKNVLLQMNATGLADFINYFSEHGSGPNLLNQKNCGTKTMKEITEFRFKVFDLLNKNENVFSNDGLFKDIEIYITEGNVLRKVESVIFRNHFGFIKNEAILSFEEIGTQFHLTKERVRQLSIKVLEKVRGIIKNLSVKGSYDLRKYFFKDHFYVTRNLTDEYNIQEATNFSPNFIVFALESSVIDEYDFFCLNERTRSYSGIFSKKIKSIDLKECLWYLLRFIDAQRKKDVALDIDKLMKKFKKEESLFPTVAQIDMIDRASFVEFLNVISNYFAEEGNIMSINSKYFVIERTSKKYIADHLMEILKRHNRPMHFTDLFDQVKENGIQVRSASSIHATLQRNSDLFGLKGPGIYGLVEWGGYFGTIGDVAERLLKERKGPMNRGELEDIICRELYITQASIKELLFRYAPEKRFIKLKGGMIGLKEWKSGI